MKLNDPIDCIATIRDYANFNGVKPGQQVLIAKTTSGKVLDRLSVNLTELRKCVKVSLKFSLSRIQVPYQFNCKYANAIVARVVQDAIMPCYVEQEEIQDILE